MKLPRIMARLVLDRVIVSQEINLQKMMDSDTKSVNCWNKECFSLIIWYSKQKDLGKKEEEYNWNIL